MRMPPSLRLYMAGLAFAALLTLGLLPERTSSGRACAAPKAFFPDKLTLASLNRLRLEQLDLVFTEAQASPPPVGFARGRVVLLSGYLLPRVSAHSAGLVWKGKQFADDGSFINQWRGFRALASHTAFDESWFDGKPCVILEYPPGTPLFARMRDEMREVRPGLYLCRCYQHTPKVAFRGYIGLECEPERRHRHR